MSEPVRVTEHAGEGGEPGALVELTLDRPAALNALDAATMIRLSEHLVAIERAFAERRGPRVVILSGAGEKAFAAGADIAAMVEMSPEEARGFSALGHRLAATIEALPLPVIAAVGGYALGGGCELALACDFIYASTKARFGLPEARLGVVPGFGGALRLLRRVGAARARELLFTGAVIDAAEALRVGLVNRVVEPAALLDEVLRVGRQIAACAPLAVAGAKSAIAEGLSRPADDALEAENRLFGTLFGTEDQRAGMRAFLRKDKAPPKWQGR